MAVYGVSALFDVEGLKIDIRVFAFIVFIIACTMDFIQLVFVFVGILTYAIIQALTVPTNFKAESKSFGNSCSAARLKCSESSHLTNQTRRLASPLVSNDCTPPTVESIRQPSLQPVAAPVFTSVGWDAEVDELVTQISPTPSSENILQQVAHFVKTVLRPLIPEVEVMGFASGDFSTGTAFRVAVPEVDIVLRVDPCTLSARLRGRDPRSSPTSQVIDMGKLRKSAIRICTDRLVATGHCKFRRSAFRGSEPKVTLLVSPSSGIHDEAIPIDLSINSTSPCRNAAVLAECGRMDPRATALALLVRRWAKDRGLCHAAKGHLSPYAWTLLSVYFMQVSDTDTPLLPPLKGCELLENQQHETLPQAPCDSAQKSVGTLFKEFIQFYRTGFDFRNEAVSVRKGVRSAPEVTLPLHIVLHEDGISTSVAPSIEDPFDRKRNLSAETTATALLRMEEELVRASNLHECNASLSEVLEPWVPAEQPRDDSRA